MLIRTLAFAVLLAAGSAGAQTPSGAPQAVDPPAAGPGGGPRAMAACRADRDTLCAGVEHGGGRMMQCMKDNYAKLSPGCQSALQAMRAARQAEKPAAQ